MKEGITLKRSDLNNLMTWGDLKQLNNYRWNKSDSKLYLKLQILLKDNGNKVYEDRRDKNCE